ncbi:MAG: hypothetical protein JWO06_3760 [Bacteroidota bacterium]|nr:hypothetical protein [Bacteroidota bacterium]
MKNLTRITLMTFVTIFISLGVYAQTGVYLTYDDFKNGKMVKADEGSIDVKVMKHVITTQEAGQKKEYECANIFAMLIKGKLYRFPIGSAAALKCELVTAGDYFIWFFSDSYMVDGVTRHEYVSYVSKGIDGYMYDVTNNGRLEKITAEHKEFQPLLDCVKAGKKLTMMHPLVTAIGECIVKEPSYKKNTADVIPPIK